MQSNRLRIDFFVINVGSVLEVKNIFVAYFPL